MEKLWKNYEIKMDGRMIDEIWLRKNIKMIDRQIKK